jgi:hypothetical protein
MRGGAAGEEMSEDEERNEEEDGEHYKNEGGEEEEEEEDDDEEESTSDDSAEGPRAMKKGSKKKSNRKMLDRIARKAQLNTTYLQELEDEVEALRKLREEEEKKAAEEERGLRDSEDTSELVKQGDEVTKDLLDTPEAEMLQEAGDNSSLSHEDDEDMLRRCLSAPGVQLISILRRRSLK